MATKSEWPQNQNDHENSFVISIGLYVTYRPMLITKPNFGSVVLAALGGQNVAFQRLASCQRGDREAHTKQQNDAEPHDS